MDKMKDLENVELRSEKVRDIMTERPPIFIRYGTAIVAMLLLSVAIIAFCVLLSQIGH